MKKDSIRESKHSSLPQALPPISSNSNLLHFQAQNVMPTKVKKMVEVFEMMQNFKKMKDVKKAKRITKKRGKLIDEMMMIQKALLEEVGKTKKRNGKMEHYIDTLKHKMTNPNYEPDPQGLDSTSSEEARDVSIALI